MNKNDSRRKLLKSLAAGSGAVVASKSLPESWSKPVVDAVMLPAHAETTDDTETLPTTTVAPTTTPDPCCDIAGDYCGYFGEGGMVEVIVSADGSVNVSLWGGEVESKASVSCAGGKFTADFGPDNYVDGTVVCGKGPILGTVSWDGAYKYTAEINGCDDR